MRLLQLRFAGALVVGLTLGWFVTGKWVGIARGSSDAPPLKRTGAPLDSGTCNACHGPSNTINDGQGQLVLVGIPASYVPGNFYAIGIGIGRTGQSRWGFEMTCLTTSGDLPAGTFFNLTDSTDVQTAIVSGQTRSYAIQSTQVGDDGTQAGTLDQAAWVVGWVAPSQGTGAVTFYSAGVAANNDNSADDGDAVYTATVPMGEGSSSPVTTTTWGAIKRAIR